MVRPRRRLSAELSNDIIWKLWAEAEGMNLMCEDMAARERGIIEVVKVVHVHIAVVEAPSRCDMEVPHNFVDSQASLYTTSFAPLRI